MNKIECLSVNNIYKSFGKKKVLDNINFTVNSNEIFGLIGLNGAGKTTLIKIILDLLDKDFGSVSIFNTDSMLTKSRRDICYLPEKFQPSSFLKGREFLSLFPGQNNRKLDFEKAKEIADLLALEPDAFIKKISQYSKGMVQKLGLLDVFLSDAKLIILDEPMSGLDPKARISLKDQLLSYRDKGNTIFFSSHILSDIDEICDRIAVLHDQQIKFIGKTSEFKKKHKEKSLERAFLKEIKE